MIFSNSIIENDDRFRRHILLIWLNRLLAHWHTNVIVISDWVGQFLREVEKIPPEKIVRIHYGLEAVKEILPELRVSSLSHTGGGQDWI